MAKLGAKNQISNNIFVTCKKIELIFKKLALIIRLSRNSRISNKFNTENGCGICEFY
jgi:hypothetical protein